MLVNMTQLRVSDVAVLLAVSDDTIRRWIDAGRLTSTVDDAGRSVLDGAEVAAFVQDMADDDLARFDPNAGLRSARNSFTGLVTKVVSDRVMSQVEMQCGRFRVVSLISTEAVHELGLEVGTLATAVVKSTNVAIERRRP